MFVVAVDLRTFGCAVVAIVLGTYCWIVVAVVLGTFRWIVVAVVLGTFCWLVVDLETFCFNADVLFVVGGLHDPGLQDLAKGERASCRESPGGGYFILI